MIKNCIIDREIKRIDEKIKALDDNKINLLREVPFKHWDKLTDAFDRIAKNAGVLLKLKTEMESLAMIYENDDKMIEIRREELKSALDEVYKRTACSMKVRDDILKDYPKELSDELQKIYIQIMDLEIKRKTIKGGINS